MKKKLERNVEEFTNLFYDTNINTWILSGDAKEKMMNFAHYIDLIERNKRNMIFNLDLYEREGIFGQIKSILYELKTYI